MNCDSYDGDRLGQLGRSHLLAAEQGGNCEYAKPGEAVVEHGVTIIGYTDMPSRMASVASDLYGMNLWHLLQEMGGAAGFTIDHANDAVRPALVLETGKKGGHRRPQL